MAPILVRVALLAIGLGLGEIAFTSLAASQPAWVLQMAISTALLAAGSAGFMVQLLGRHETKGPSDG